MRRVVVRLCSRCKIISAETDKPFIKNNYKTNYLPYTKVQGDIVMRCKLHKPPMSESVETADDIGAARLKTMSWSHGVF
jgi:hypothetical protein